MQYAGVTVTAVPDCVTVSFSPVLAVTPAGTSKVMVHPVTVAEPALVTVYVPTLPADAYAARRLPAANALVLRATVPAMASTIVATTDRALERGFDDMAGFLTP